MLTAIVGTACSSEPGFGELGASCPNDQNCIGELVCRDGVCSEPEAPGPDAGTPDSGVPRDTGVVARPDAGTPPQDAGQPDAERLDTGIMDAEVPDLGPPDAGCAVPPTLSAIQSQIFQAPAAAPNCTNATCHGAAAAGGVQLDVDLATLHATLLDDTSALGAPQTKRVVPGNPSQSRLYIILTEQNPGGGGGPMPPSFMLDGCDIESIRQWILDGAPMN